MVYVFVSGTALLFLDQWSKMMVQRHLPDRCLSWRILRIGRVTHRKNIYARGGFRVLLVLVWCMALIAAIGLYRSGVWFQSPLSLLGLGLALGGAAGNLLDVLRFRYIIDFVDLRWWPVFNVADVAIVAGLAVALLLQS